MFLSRLSFTVTGGETYISVTTNIFTCKVLEMLHAVNKINRVHTVHLAGIHSLLQLPEPGSHAVGHNPGLQRGVHGRPPLQPEQRLQHGQRGHSPAGERVRQVYRLIVFSYTIFIQYLTSIE
jgi:hypothetical protein